MGPKLNFMALSGSARLTSTNTALLRGMTTVPSERYAVRLYDAHLDLPIFNPDNDGPKTPPAVERFCSALSVSDGIIISSPEYVYAVPGGLKNAMTGWSREKRSFQSRLCSLTRHLAVIRCSSPFA